MGVILYSIDVNEYNKLGEESKQKVCEMIRNIPSDTRKSLDELLRTGKVLIGVEYEGISKI